MSRSAQTSLIPEPLSCQHFSMIDMQWDIRRWAKIRCGINALVYANAESWFDSWIAERIMHNSLSSLSCCFFWHFIFGHMKPHKSHRSISADRYTEACVRLQVVCLVKWTVRVCVADKSWSLNRVCPWCIMGFICHRGPTARGREHDTQREDKRDTEMMKTHTGFVKHEDY